MSVALKIKKITKERSAKDPAKLKKHKKYYAKMAEKGLVKKQGYNLKNLSAI